MKLKIKVIGKEDSRLTKKIKIIAEIKKADNKTRTP